MGRALMCHGWTTRILNISITNCFSFETQTKDLQLFPKSAECISLFVFSPAFSSSLGAFLSQNIESHIHPLVATQKRHKNKWNSVEGNKHKPMLGGTGAQASCRSFVDGVIYSLEQCLQLIRFQYDFCSLSSPSPFPNFFLSLLIWFTMKHSRSSLIPIGKN